MNETKILSRADIYEKKQEIEKSRVETEFNRLEENKKRSEQLKNFSLDALEAEKGEKNAKKAIGILERDKQLIRQSITFVSPEFSAVCPLTSGGLYLVGAISGTGKCFQKGTEVLMFDGTVKKVEDVIIGDLVMGPDSKPRTVTSLASGTEQMYEVKPSKGDSYFVNKSHILTLKCSTKRPYLKGVKKDDIVNVSVEEYLKSNRYKYLKGYRSGVQFEEKSLPIDPYCIGYWLGDGVSEGTSFCTADVEVVNHISSLFKNDKDLKLLNDKHIPFVYKTGSRKQRLELLAGLVDSDGSNSCNCIDFIFKSKKLADDVVYLCRSLGFAAYIKNVKKAATNSKDKIKNNYFRISVSGSLEEIPTKIPRKQFNKRQQIKNVLNHSIKVIPTCEGEYFGFGVEGPDHRFLLADFTVVHNSTTTAALAHTLYTEGKNTFIVSNEETSAKIYARIACADLGVDFNMFIQDKVPDNVRKQVAHKILEIEPYITVADDAIGSTTIEPLEKLLHEVNASGKYSCIIIDFAQRIVKSIKNPTAERTQVLYMLKDLLTDYSQNAKIPVVLMTQLKPLPSDEIERNFEARIKWCTALLEAAAAAIEIIKLKGLPVSVFYVAKGRFSKADISVTHKYDTGKFNFINKSDLKRMKDSIQLQQLNALVQEQDDVEVEE